MEQKSSCWLFLVGGKGKIGYWRWLLLCCLSYCVYQRPVAAIGMPLDAAVVSGHDTLCFFGESLVLPAVSVGDLPYCRGWSEKKVKRFYGDLFQTDFRQFLNFCTVQAGAMCIGDWGYYLLVERIAAHYFPKDTLSATVFTCFMMRRSGYECTLTYRLRQRQIACYVCTLQRVDYRHHLYRRGKCYSQVCGTDCPGGIELDWSEMERKMELGRGQKETMSRLRALDLRMTEAPLIGSRFCERRFCMSIGTDSLEVAVCYNPQHLVYYDRYPFTSLDVYFNTPLPVMAAERLKESFMPLLLRLPLFERADFLLRYVQFAYRYETDHAQFGREKYNFAEESLHYDAADCDDRSILYATLLRLLVPEVEVIGLNFPLHVCAAVAFPDSMGMGEVVPRPLEIGGNCAGKSKSAAIIPLGDDADFIEWKGRRYYVADPTYAGAGIGESMPAFRQMEPEVIELMPLWRKTTCTDKAGGYSDFSLGQTIR